MSLFLYLYIMDLIDIIEQFNNDDLDVEQYFNDYQTFFNILKKKGLMSEIDPKNAVNSIDWQNEYVIWLYNNDKESFYNWITSLLGDIEIIGDKAYLEINDRSELSKLFCKNSRNGLSRSTIETLLSGDNDWDPHWDTTDNVYRDVIEELTPENTKRLYEYIIDSLNGEQIQPETDLLEIIAEEQGHPEYVEVNSENIERIVDHEETMEELLDNQLSDLKSELYSIHSSAYNSAYEDDVYDSIWSKLEEYFIGHGEFVSRPHTYKKNTTVQNFIIQIRDFEQYIIDYLYDNKSYGNTGTLEYWGSYLSLLEESDDCLDVYPPDYPNSRKVDKNINTYFGEYI